MIWPVSGSSGVVRGMAVDALDVDLAAALPLALLERGPAGVAHRAGRHPRHPRRGRGARRADRSRSCASASATSSVPSSVRATWRITPTTPWPTSAAAECTTALAVGVEHDTGRAEVVEPLRVADVLEAEREADAAPDALAARRVARAAGQPERVARQLLGAGTGSAAARRITSRVGQRAR